MSITEVSIIHHIGIVLALLWLLSSFNCCHPVAYFMSLIYLYNVHERYSMRLRRKLQFEERRSANQRRVLSDSETVRWLNHAVEKMWLVCMEHIVSQKILLSIIPWFLEKYKPWTARKAVVQHLYMGRNPPMFTEMRVLRQSTDDDHLVLELGMNFLTGDDMSAILAVKLRKRLGGMWAKLHITGMHVEGKVLIGIKFLRKWPFLGRLRVCFVEPPYFQMTVKPISTHGIDVTELPGIAGWLDKLLSVAFEQTLVEPNMLVVDVEKFASPGQECWFSVDGKEPIAYAKVEVIEASDMKPSDLNGLADPYVKGQLGSYRFKTKTQRKTLTPKWHEEFKIPICSWESPNMLTIEVRDKDHFIDDTLGDCSVNISNHKDGQRHDLWLSLQNIKMGRLHLAITVLEVNGKEPNTSCDWEASNKEDSIKEDSINSVASQNAQNGSSSYVSSETTAKLADKFEPVDIEGQRETGIWVHHPGTDFSQKWEPRKGKMRLLDTEIHGESNDYTAASRSFCNDDSSSDENLGTTKLNLVQRGLQKISAVFNRSPGKEDQCDCNAEVVLSPHVNIKATNAKGIGVKFVVEDSLSEPISVKAPIADRSSSPGESSLESPSRGNVKDMARNMIKQAGKSARSIKHVISRKGSSKYRGDHSGLLATHREISIESDSSDEESLPSSTYTPRSERDPLVLNPVPSHANDFFNSEEHIVESGSNNPEMSPEKMEHKSASSPERIVEGLGEKSSNSEAVKENLESERT
ncbi:C2 domain-containing protein At1g53590-like [Malania oleifera]|uniref:C2 domain-containing protein At1g53590-like n=1 Tax=Malania oleifera TaxID=397392 RepID=UPI0025AE9951|nr:C2 domain-containing protein At1g53590-like [Malania oleifera]